MNVLLINGSPHANGCTQTALNEIAGELTKNDVDSSMLHIGKEGIKGCTACMGCVKTGYCVFKDDKVNECIDLLKQADGLIVGSPVYFAGPNASLCGFLDRVFYQKADPYAFKPGAAIVSSRRGGTSAAFDRLNKYFTFAQMPLVSSHYWNSVHGTNADELKQDVEGLQIMRILARNMAWLLKCIDNAKGTVPYPTLEKRTKMSFIR
ncbi:flavodoxin, putative [Syntrophotalea carbinolica DSM 2380]|uniref:Flavodoxin, putative n=1 Tax=Syntrophotalea carbinolica (strain DSM 2380 / NBRC 103641 / GraBd1) TaxID=338963 RepID=Q3A858_SYNC1|nr:flavodoxin family protein [Syntrophotalea carbinolica]ABA87434.1 flavodoxin, putative [Syntrophotalea carbinolica DSM 2380]